MLKIYQLPPNLSHSLDTIYECVALESINAYKERLEIESYPDIEVEGPVVMYPSFKLYTLVLGLP